MTAETDVGIGAAASARGRQRWWRSSWFRRSLVALVMAVGAVVLVGKWDDYEREVRQAEPGWLAAAIALLIVGNTLSALLGRELLAGRGIPVSRRGVARMVLIGNVAKYVPGLVTQAATYYELGRDAGLEARATVVLWIESTWVTLAVTSAAGAACLFVVGSSIPSWITAGAAIGATVAAVPPVRDRALKFTRLLPSDVQLCMRPQVRALLLAALGTVLLGLHGIALARALGATEIGFAEVLGALAGGWVIGLLAFFFPGGFGPRELVAATLLGAFTTSSTALVLVLLSRFASIVADVIAGGIAAVLPRTPHAELRSGVPDQRTVGC